MILFLDTSDFVKLYIEESGGDMVMRRFRQARLLAVSELALIECHSALARLWREGKLTKLAWATLRREVLTDLKAAYLQVRVSERLKQSACRLLAAHSLRSLDALQLASALIVKNNRRQQILFPSFDAKLNLAARAAGLDTLQSGSAMP